MRFFLLVLSVFIFCSYIDIGQDSQHGISVETNPYRKLKKDFRYHNLEFFTFDPLPITGDTVYKFKGFDSATYFTLLKEVGSGFYPLLSHYLFSWQERDSGLTEFTVAITAETDAMLQYIILDSLGRHRGHFTAAALGVDEDETFKTNKTYGRFIDRNTYEAISIEEKLLSETETTDSTKSVAKTQVDSTVRHYIIGQTGSVVKKEVSKTSFKKEYVDD